MINLCKISVPGCDVSVSMEEVCAATVCVTTGRPPRSPLLSVIRRVSLNRAPIKACVSAGRTAADLSLIGWGGNL